MLSSCWANATKNYLQRMLVMALVFFALLLLISVYVLIFRTLLYYLDLLYTNMCPIEIPAKGQLREVRMRVLQQFKLHALYEILEVLCYLNFILPFIYLHLYDTCLQMPLLGKKIFFTCTFCSYCHCSFKNPCQFCDAEQSD